MQNLPPLRSARVDSHVTGSFGRIQQLRPGDIVALRMDGKQWKFRITWSCLFDRNTEDASKAPAPHVAGQDCSNCNFYQGAATGFGPCQLFPGKAVNAKGWCAGYAKKA